jgi:hypothetical protein
METSSSKRGGFLCSPGTKRVSSLHAYMFHVCVCAA